MKKFFKVAAIAVAAFIGLLLIIILSSPAEDPNEVTKVATKETTVPVSKEEVVEASVEDEVYAIGDTVKYRDLELTILSAAFTTPDEYGEPEKGKVLTIEVEAVNKGDREIMVDNTEFSVYDLEGNLMSQYYSYSESTISDSINTDRKLTGKVFFDTIDAKQLEVIYTPSFSYDGEVEIKFIVDVTPN